MTWFSSVNPDAQSVTPDQAATGPKVGFLEAFNTAYEAQTRAASQFGIEYHMSELDNQQTKALRDAGVADAPSLIGELTNYYGLDAERFTPGDDQYQSGEYLEVARNVAGEGDVPWIGERSKQYDDKIKALRIQFPDLQLRTSDEMFKSVREAAQEAERKEATDRRTWGGAAGGFLGGTLASMDPRTDPLNFATLGLGGAGKTAVQRILVQGGAQGAVEALNQVTGVQEERRLQGLSHGFGDAAMRVGATAVGGAALQGAGEALVAGARRFFRNTPTDPAPAPAVIETPRPKPLPLRVMTPDQLVREARVARLEQQGGRALLDAVADKTPLSGLRTGRLHVAVDLADVTRQLQTWTSVMPTGMSPRTTATLRGVDVSAAVKSNMRYQAAREIDPVSFRKYDALVAQRALGREAVQLAGDQRGADITETLANMARMHRELINEHQTARPKQKAAVMAKIRELESDRRLLKQAANADTPEMVAARQAVIRADEKMRELGPMLARAYARADETWDDRAYLDAVWDAYAAGKVEADPPLNPTYSPDTLMTLYDRVPALQRAPVDTPPNKPVTDVVREVIAEDVKIQDEALEVYRSSIRSVLSENVVKTEYTPAQLKTNMEANGGNANDYLKTLAADVRSALEAGGKVFMDIEGKRREMFWKDGALRDKQGNPWGLGGLAFAVKADADKVALTIERPPTVTLAGTDHTFNLTDRMFDADGNEVTVREMLDDLQMKDQELEAFTSCSIR